MSITNTQLVAVINKYMKTRTKPIMLGGVVFKPDKQFVAMSAPISNKNLQEVANDFLPLLYAEKSNAVATSAGDADAAITLYLED